MHACNVYLISIIYIYISYICIYMHVYIFICMHVIYIYVSIYTYIYTYSNQGKKLIAFLKGKCFDYCLYQFTISLRTNFTLKVV